MKERGRRVRVLVNPLAMPLPKTGPITTNGIDSNYKLSPESIRRHEAMAVIPNPEPEILAKNVNSVASPSKL